MEGAGWLESIFSIATAIYGFGGVVNMVLRIEHLKGAGDVLREFFRSWKGVMEYENERLSLETWDSVLMSTPRRSESRSPTKRKERRKEGRKEKS